MFNVVINNEQYDEYLTQKETIKELEARIKETDVLKAQIDFLYKEYQQALSDEAAIIKERDDLLIENEELRNKVIRFKELVTENYRLKMSVNDLKEHNKELKAKIKEPVGMVKIDLDRDWKGVYPPDRNTNIKIENLYITNNYFSEEDERND
jgi:hypothetical protein